MVDVTNMHITLQSVQFGMLFALGISQALMGMFRRGRVGEVFVWSTALLAVACVGAHASPIWLHF